MRVPAVGIAIALAAGAASAQELQPRIGDPLPGLTAAERVLFDGGKLEFTRILTTTDGLGPIFNDSSCSTCHSSPRAGGAGAKRVTRFGKAGTPFDPLASLGGSLLQVSATLPTCVETVPPQADVQIQRVTPSTAGSGLIEAILGGEIRAREFAPPAGVSGRAHMVRSFEKRPAAKLDVGRFGWKAQLASILSFSADASQNELGLSNRFIPTDNAPNGNGALLAVCDTRPDPEDHPDGQGLDAIDRQANFQRLLAAPPQTPRSGMTGATVFNTVACNSCHVSTPYVTGPSPAGFASLAGKTIRPYSDFLLHDVGSLGDGIVQGMATENEFRTPPLWGLLPRAEVGLLHDARATGGTLAQNVRDAITAHAGEAQASRDAYLALAPAQQDQLVAFLLSLGRVEFDQEADHDVDEFDWFFFESAPAPSFTGPGVFFNADSPAAIADFDQDGDFDLVDFAGFQRAMTGDQAAFNKLGPPIDAGSDR
jgi:di-heme oxidoreductase (putative peroxidase)